MPYQLVQLKNGEWSVHSSDEDETFHPVIGPEAEADALYVRQLRLAERLASHPDRTFVIWDVGLGAAANALTALRALKPVRGHVRMLSFDRTLEPLRFALHFPDKLGFLSGYEHAVSEFLNKGTTHFENGRSTVLWEQQLGDFPTLLNESSAEAWPKPDAILFDAYSPAKNPAMWSWPLFDRLFKVVASGPPCNLATYSRATLIRTTLLLAGWTVGRGFATGEKEETTVASTIPAMIECPLEKEWLGRAERSTSAEPLMGNAYRQAPLSKENWDRLRNHPQFQTY